MTNVSVIKNTSNSYTGGIPLNVTLHAWPVPQWDLKPLNGTTSEVNRSGENYTNNLHNLNATGYVAIDDGLTDTGFTDVQTFILAGIATVIPLLITVSAILGIRFIWRKYKARKEDGYEGVLQKDESTDPLGKLQGYSLPQELKSGESHFTITPGEEPVTTPSPQLPTPKSNGSIITMTLKNNHLIVETEETSNTPATLKIESKGTTTKFVTPAGTDFKVNCERAMDGDKKLEHLRENMYLPNNHGALIHYAPEETEDEMDKRSSNTGLSQSDLSVSSNESQNPSYRYGNQMGYDSGGFGYPEYSGYSTNAQKQPFSTTPKTNIINSKNSTLMEYADSLPSNASEPIKNILSSDIEAQEEEYARRKQDQYTSNQNSPNKTKNEISLNINQSTIQTTPTNKEIPVPTNTDSAEK